MLLFNTANSWYGPSDDHCLKISSRILSSAMSHVEKYHMELSLVTEVLKIKVLFRGTKEIHNILSVYQQSDHSKEHESFFQNMMEHHLVSMFSKVGKFLTVGKTVFCSQHLHVIPTINSSINEIRTNSSIQQNPGPDCNTWYIQFML